MNIRSTLDSLGVMGNGVLFDRQRECLFTALQEGLFTVEQYNQLWGASSLLVENGLTALREHLFDINQLIELQLQIHKIDLLLTTKGLIALREKLITPAAAKHFPNGTSLEKAINNRVDRLLLEKKINLQLLAQGGRSSTSYLSQVPLDVLGKTASFFRPTEAEDKLTNEIEKINKEKTQCRVM